MLTFALVPQTRFATGFQSTEKPSSQTPTPINQAQLADTFTPSAVKSRIGMGKHASWAEGRDMIRKAQLEVELRNIADKLSIAVENIVRNAPDLKRKFLGGEYRHAIESWVKNTGGNPRQSISEQDLGGSLTTLENLITNSDIKKELKEESLQFLTELKTVIEQLKSLSI